RQVLTDVAADHTVTLSQQDAVATIATHAPEPHWFRDVTDSVRIDFSHHENAFYDFHREPLIPHLLSAEGPALAVGDVDGDGLYVNDGHRHFARATLALPRLAESGSCVVPGDFNGDGHVDLFVGRRAVARRYGLTPRSYLLENDGAGHFVDVTLDKAPGLAQA